MLAQSLEQQTLVEPQTSELLGRVPRRDYYMIPLISLATIIAMFVTAEVAARIFYPAKDYEECRVQGADDPREAKTNCTVRAKVAEGPWVTYRMNECGFRTYAFCAAKPANTIRLVTLGASMTMGKNVPLEQTWGERTGRAISEATGRKVEVENMGWELLSPLDCYRQLWRVIQLKPELVVYAVNPFDLSRDIDPNQLVHRNERVLPRRASTPVVEDRGQALRDTLKFIQNSLADSRAFTIAQHFLFSNPDTFLRIYLADGDRADYVRQPFTNLWQQRFTNFNLIVGEMAARLKKAGIPFVIISLPARAQVALVEKGHYPRHTDPFAFDREIEKICQNAGVTYVPTLEAFSATPNGDQLFYVVDTHITGTGNAIIAKQLEQEVMNGSIPALTPRTDSDLTSTSTR